MHDTFWSKIGSISSAFITAVTLLILMSPASAQTSTGSIVGIVRDNTGAVLPGTDVVLLQTETGRVISIQANGEGAFLFPALDPGIYKIRCNRNGFEESTVENIRIEPAQALKVDVELKVGSTTTEVVVQADQAVKSDTPTISAVVSSKVIQDTPLPDRSALELAVFTPGVVGDPQFANGSQSEVPGIFLNAATPGASFQIGGGRPGLASQLVDGFDTTLNAYPRAGVTLSSETTQAINVQQVGLDAQYGRNGGGVLNQATRAGGEKYHGAVSFRNQEPFLEARIYNPPSASRPPARHQEEFAGIFSGPVPTWGQLRGQGQPKEHKTFFLVAVEPLRQTDQNYSRGRLITPDEAAGRLNNSLDLLDKSVLASQGYAAALAAPRVGSLYYQNALNNQGFPVGGLLPQSQYTKIPNNDISAQVAQNATVKGIFSYLPTPGIKSNYAFFTHPDGSYDPDANNAVVVRGVKATDNRYSIRVDQLIANSDKLFVRYTYVPVDGVRYNFLGPASPANAIAADDYKTSNVGIGETHIFNSHVVNEMRLSYLSSDRERAPAPAALTKDYGAGYGLLAAVTGRGFPGIGGLPQNLGSGGSQSDGGKSLDRNTGLGDDVSILKGNHSIKIGVEILALQLNRNDNSYLNGGQYAFSAAQTNSGTAGGSALASFELGLINNFSTAAPQPYYYRWKYYAGYVQDTWKATARLTVNYGLRYSLEMPRKEKFNLQGSFDPTAVGTLSGLSVSGGLVLAGQNGRSNLIFPANYKGFEPRLGLSYAFSPRITMRASYGLVHAQLTGVGDAVVPNLAAAAQNVGPLTGGVSAGSLNYVTNPIKPIPALPTQKNGPLFTFSGSAPLPFISQSNAVPYVQLWSYTLDFQVSPKTSIEASYVGNRGTHLYSDQVSTNVPKLNTLLDGISNHVNFNAVVSNVYGLGNETYLQSLSPYQQVYNNPVNIYYPRTTSSIYQAMYISVARELRGGLSGFANLSWSKSLDTASDNTTDLTNIYGEPLPQSSYYSVTPPQYSYSTFDTPLRLAGGFTAAFPVGRGKAVNVNNRFANLLVGGWLTTGLFSLQDGFPFWGKTGGNAWFISTLLPATGAPIPGSGGSAVVNGNINPNPSIVPGVKLIKSNWRHDPFASTGFGGGYVNQAAFAVPGSYGNPQFGNAPRTMGNLRTPFDATWDQTLRKDIPLGSDRVRLKLQLDAINVLNHVNFFFNPNSNHTLTSSFVAGSASTPPSYNISTAFGALSNASPNRIVAFGGRISF